MEQLAEIHQFKKFEYYLNKNTNDLWKQLSRYEDTSNFADIKAQIDKIR